MVPVFGRCPVSSYDVVRQWRRPARRVGGLDSQDGQLRDIDALPIPRTWWLPQAGPSGLNAPPELLEQGDATPMEPPTADRQQSAAADDGSAQAEFRRVQGAVIAVLLRRHRERRDRFILCGPLWMNGVGVSDGPAFGACVGAARVGEEMHQAESKEQHEEQSTDRPSPCSCSVAHALRHLAVAPTWRPLPPLPSRRISVPVVDERAASGVRPGGAERPATYGSARVVARDAAGPCAAVGASSPHPSAGAAVDL